MILLLLALQVAPAATPSSTPTPVVRGGSLADLARNRKLASKSFSIAPAGTPSAAARPAVETPGPEVAAVPETEGAPAVAPAPNEAEWRERGRRTRAALKEAEARLAEYEAKNPAPAMVTTVNQQIAHLNREALLAPYRKAAQDARKDLDDLFEECRRGGCSPGWIR